LKAEECIPALFKIFTATAIIYLIKITGALQEHKITELLI
jgi:hypothetical protein